MTSDRTGKGAASRLRAVIGLGFGLDVPIMAGNANMVRAQLGGYQGFAPKVLLFPGILGMTPLASSAGITRHIPLPRSTRMAI